MNILNVHNSQEKKISSGKQLKNVKTEEVQFLVFQTQCFKKISKDHRSNITEGLLSCRVKTIAGSSCAECNK
jgi:hypothetical protein